MSESFRPNASARMLIILLAASLAVMLAVSLKARFQNPHLTVPGRQQSMPAEGGEAEGGQSIGALMRQVSENPQDLNALLHLIEHLVVARNWEAAETFAQRAVTMDVSNPKPLYLLGIILHNQGRNKEAAEALEKVLAIKDEASVRYSLGVLYLYFLNEPKRGIEQLQAGLKDPEAGADLKATIQRELEKNPPAQVSEPAPAARDATAKDAAASVKKGGRKNGK